MRALFALLVLVVAACAPTIQIYTETPDKEALLQEAGNTIGVRTKIVDAPGPGVVSVEFRSKEGNDCGWALEKIVGADTLRDALTNGIVDCEPKAWTCDHVTYASHELAHVVGLLRHTETGLMAPAPERDAQLTEAQKRRVRALGVVFNEVCR